MTENTQKKRATLQDVSELAGVGTATVDRVINERGNVSNDVRQRVLQAAREMGLRRSLPESHHRMVRINVILARPELPLIGRMGIEFRRLSDRMDHSVAIYRTTLEDESPAAVAQALLRSDCDVVVVYAQDHPTIRAAIADLAGRGKPVITMISDLPGSARLAYAGTDHLKSGRSAGYFLSRMAPAGPVIVLCNHLGFQSRIDRLRGLTDYLTAHAPGFPVVQIVEGGDDAVRSEARLKDAFRSHTDTVAIYNVGAGNRGVVAAIQAELLRHRPVFIGHELTSFTWESLRSGVMTLTIDQSPELQAQFALDVALNHFNFASVSHLSPPYVSTVPIVLYGPENLPEYAPD
ncbi:LacI family DNA-binding transcriptional regulator [Cypionkella sp.]|uniref:LacI family DNA-binding transcriptional regulator n=1 Tax=Cypionkella sp. TaxID=2811411 RepID=UPI00262F893F|nr:LacI family DNA-binding transcriptional regulator [Cypionkella sp.]